jgi:hypothetical protein
MATIRRLAVALAVLTPCVLFGQPQSYSAGATPAAPCKPLVTMSHGTVFCYAPALAAEAGRRMAFTPLDPRPLATRVTHLQLKQILLWSSKSPAAHVPVPSVMLYVFGAPPARQTPPCKTGARARFLLVEETAGSTKSVVPRALCKWQAHSATPGAHLAFAIGSDGPIATTIGLAKHLRDTAVAQSSPTATVTATPTATATDRGAAPVVILAENGSALNLAVGDHFLLDLGSAFTWSVNFNPPLIVAKANDLSQPANTQGYYSAIAAGQTLLTAVGTPTCRNTVPQCERPSILFRLNILVRAAGPAVGPETATPATSTGAAY